jgi:hypothetical protein
MDNMITKGWCVKNASYGSSVGRNVYSCDADPRSRLFDNYDEFLESRVAAHDLMLRDGANYAITNNETLDYEGMFADGYMFSEQAVITFKYMIGSRSMRPFDLDCYSAFDAMDFSFEMVNLLKDKTAKPKSYLIELTNDISVIDEFNNMRIVNGSPTHVTSGLLRSLPVVAKGTNPRKAIIVISDGIDSGSTTSGPMR